MIRKDLIKSAGVLKLARNQMIKKATLILFSVILISTHILAENQQKYEIDNTGGLVQFWFDGLDLKYLNSPTQNGITLLSFTREVEAFGIKHDNSEFFLAYKFKKENQSEPIYYRYSNDEGRSFTPPIILANDGAKPSITFSNNVLAAAWEENNGITVVQSLDRGRNFSPPLYFAISGEVLSSPVISFDPNNNLHLGFISQNPSNFLYRIFYAQVLTQSPTPAFSIEPKEIFRSQDEIVSLLIKNLPHPLILWQEQYNHRLNSYLSLSLDKGNHFSAERPLACDQMLEDFASINGKYLLLTFNQKAQIKEIKFPDIYTPKIASPTANKAYSAYTFQVKYLYPDYQRDWARASQLISEIDLATDASFTTSNTLIYNDLVFATPEALSYSPLLKLQDGNYYIRIDVFDGLSNSAYSATTPFKIDNSLPDLITLEAETNFDHITFKGQVNKPSVDLTINGYKPVFQLNNQFQLQTVLSAGQNKFTFILTDEAGNQNIITREAYFNPQAPVIQLIQPMTGQWFKPGSTVFFEANVTDAQNDIDDETEAQLFINSQAVPDPLIYNLPEKKLSGFVTLPPQLPDGQYPAKIEIADRLGNKGTVNLNINIDGSPPIVSAYQSNQLYCNSTKSLSLPLNDTGAGVDASGTLIKIGGVSLEGAASVESDHLSVVFKSPPAEGSYEVQVLPRDRVGNIGSVQTFSLVIDNTPPILTLESSLEPVTQLNSLTINGKVESQIPCSLNIYDNNNKIASLSVKSLHFSKEIRLLPGNNYFLVEAVDLAGNKTSQAFMIKAQITGNAALLKDCINGPNPFSPVKKEVTYFTYAFNDPAVDPVNLKILVYDLSGKLIWNKEIPNAPTRNSIGWDGTDYFGKKLANGVYPYLISVSAGDQHEIRRGKIVVLN